MPDIVKILLGLAAFGGLASIVMIILNIIAGRQTSASEDWDEDENGYDVTQEAYTQAYPDRSKESEEPLFTPLGEEEEFRGGYEEQWEEPEEVTVREEPEPLTLYKKEEPAPRKKAFITPAVVEYDDEPETVYKETARDLPVFPAQEESVTIEEQRPIQSVEPATAIIGDLRLSVGNAQSIGRRDQQQDAFAITPLEERDVVMSHGVMAVVCDGMGGLENGAEAANLGAISFMRSYLRREKVTGDSLLEAVNETNSIVHDTFEQGDTPAGTTLAAASIMPSGLRFVSVGDSHIYLYRRGRIYQINRDHNYFAELMEQVKAGKMTLQEAQTHPERAHLTSYVGLSRLEKVDYNTEAVALRPGDRVVLCTDGLFKTLSLEEIASTIAACDAFDVQDKLMEAMLAKNKRRQDNATIVVLYCDRV